MSGRELSGDEIEDILADYVLRHSLSFSGTKEELPREVSLIESGIFDSVEIVALVQYVRGRFEIGVSPEEYTRENMGSLRKIRQFVQGKLRAKSAGAR